MSVKWEITTKSPTSTWRLFKDFIHDGLYVCRNTGALYMKLDGQALRLRIGGGMVWSTPSVVRGWTAEFRPAAETQITLNFEPEDAA